MLRKQPPVWVFLGSTCLTVIAGSTNAVGFLSVAHQGMTHVTGTVTLSTIELARGNVLLTLRAITLVVAFFFGAAMSGVLIRDPQARPGQRYGVALLVESALLFTAMGLFDVMPLLAECVAAVACGMQNALATNYSGALLRTTHMTGIVTDLGLTIGHALHRQPVDWFRFRLYVVLLAGFIGGGIIGGFVFPYLHQYTLVVPAGLALLLGAWSLAWLMRQRHQHPPV